MRGFDITLEQAEAHNKRVRARRAGQAISLPSVVEKTQSQGKRRGAMNGLESRYAAEILDPQKLAGHILDYYFEGITLKLAHNTRYTPDFTVVMTNGAIEFHETKGFWRDDAKVKIKVAAEKFKHFIFIAARKVKKKDGGGWKYERF